MPNAFISGTGSYVPPRVVTNEDLRTEFGIDTSHEWIHKRTGIEERHFAADGVGTAELAEHATRAALESAGLEAHELDAIVLATLSPDYHFPGSGVLLQHRLGLSEGDNVKFVPALDVRNQCSGFLYSLSVANGWVRSGMYKHVLVVGAETHSHALDLTTRGRTVSSLFGDGAGAVVVSATEEDRGIRGVYLGSNGKFADALCQKIWDISCFPYVPLDEEGGGLVSPDMLWAHMEGRTVFRNAVQAMTGALMEACKACETTIADIDMFAFHQANMRINEYVAKMLELPAEKVPHNIHKYGNTTAATIPLLLDETRRDGRLKDGMKVGVAAFGSGFTWGSAVIDW
jgi:3-oxoacyl-[acyl-carrier-protein] synthase-3